MATAPTYCTHRQLKDVFPQVDSFDNKRSVYGWGEEDFADWLDTTLDIGFCYNVGLATQLFVDGNKINKIGYSKTATSTLAAELSASASSIDVADGSDFGVGDIIKINNEYLGLTNVSSNTLTFTLPAAARGLFDTSAVIHSNGSSVYIIIDASANVGDATSDGKDALAFVNDTDLDLILLIHNSLTLNDHQIEVGEDFDTLISRITANASRYLDAKLDPNLPKEQLKDKEGNFDYIIVRTTALLAATFLIRAHDPTSEIATALMEDAEGNIDALNKGGAALSWQTTGDSSKGIIRDVSYTSGSVRPVDTRGRWSGSFDLIRVKIETGGAMDGTATYSVWVKDGDKLGNQQGSQVVTSEKINGDYQSLAGGLQIRFGGSTKTSVATATNEWEIEVAGWQEEVDNSTIKSVKMTRR